jgi:release factor glutamine methyltransferase
VTAGEALRSLTDALLPVAGDLARREAEEVLLRAAGLRRHELYLAPGTLLDEHVPDHLQTVARRRASGEPLAYVLGVAYFHSLDLVITPDVLIPRPDTETLVERIVADQPASSARCFLDLGTGSGAVAAALLHIRPLWQAVATDISPAALRTARRNLPERCSLVCADRLEALGQRARFDFVACNPPYIASGEIDGLEESVRCFEPRLALDGGSDGLAFYRHLAAEAGRCLADQGMLYCEIGWSQREDVMALMRDRGWHGVACTPDLAGRPRVVSARWHHAA